MLFWRTHRRSAEGAPADDFAFPTGANGGNSRQDGVAPEEVAESRTPGLSVVEESYLPHDHTMPKTEKPLVPDEDSRALSPPPPIPPKSRIDTNGPPISQFPASAPAVRPCQSFEAHGVRLTGRAREEN